ncbi:hypothetical protein S7711_00133 [Stachybotrys chartarum IBT 7711]|uniref:Solute carrier family 40 member n=1 Tax=Stachybotrys chartarum (strain CBS 109288 / IBT 7711) TaxID=1280523 RepID=A0A084B3J2_STACB|nr:hypothetical protein S7711_00133 [Stachybotrys chartarum IBT 7711]
MPPDQPPSPEQQEAQQPLTSPLALDTDAEASLPRALQARLYTSHFLSTWNARLFEFGAVLFLADIYPSTLLPMSVYALARAAAAVLLAQAVGSSVDRGHRLVVVRVSILAQRLAVAVSCVVLWAMSRYGRRRLAGSGVDGGLFVVAVVLACVEKLAAMMNLVAVERDWVVLPPPLDIYSHVLVLNARMRRIDLICKLVGPLAISSIAIASTDVAIYVTFGMSVASAVVEYVCIEQVYHLSPSLQRPRPPPLHDVTAPPGLLTILAHRILPIHSLPFYFRHSAFLPSLSLALLYLTVLSFSGQMITFLLAAGYNTALVGIARTISTVLELSATWVAPRLTKRVGAVRCGIWCLSWQMAWLTVGLAWYFADFFATGSPRIGAATGLAVAVALSRVGLWGYDLSAQLIVQDEVEESHRGTFSTVEAAFQNIGEMLSYTSTIIFSRPDQFQWPVLLSVAATYTAGGLYAAFVRDRRGHLVHPPAWLHLKPRSHGAT